MNFKILEEPNNLWGKWVQCRMMQQRLVLVGLFFLSIFPFAKTIIEDLQQKHLIEQERIATEEKLIHQQHIHTTLQQKVDMTSLSPMLTQHIPPINDKIRQFARLGEVKQEWQMAQTPRLHLQIDASFVNFIQFFTALLQDFPELSLISLHMEKSDKGVQSVLLLQLQSKKEAQ